MRSIVCRSTAESDTAPTIPHIRAWNQSRVLRRRTLHMPALHLARSCNCGKADLPQRAATARKFAMDVVADRRHQPVFRSVRLVVEKRGERAIPRGEVLVENHEGVFRRGAKSVVALR